MSEKKKRFMWSADEKDWLKTWQPRLRRDLKQISEQVERFENALPSLAAEARDAAEPFLSVSWKLMELSWKTKYNPLSREEAESEYKKIDEKLSKWIAFVRREDVSNAVRGINRDVQAQKRDYRRSLRDAEDQVRVYACSPEFENLVQKDVEVVKEGLRVMARLSVTLHAAGSEQETPILERLISLAFVRAAHDFNPEASDALRAFLAANPSATSRELLVNAVKTIRADAMLRRVKHPSIRGLDPEAFILSYLEQADRGISRYIQSWRKQGISLSQLDKSHFIVQGVDFSLDAKPI